MLCLLTSVRVHACETQVCLVDAESLQLPRIIDFDEARSTLGPGHIVQDLLVMQGAVFGERFAGQNVYATGHHDSVSGTPLSPLTVMPGASGQNLSIVYFDGNNILNGYGVAGYPKRHAQGEGAISFLFDENQSALAFQVRGGEAGGAEVTFFSRDGAVLSTITLPNAGESSYGFIHAQGAADIAGVLLTNTDPQGLALDNIRFGKSPDLS
ncbi:MAG: hypothetical protein V2I76_07975 [Roseobacter sp.]|nr:hypothetical protein [Roseobacter sp.]